MAVGRKLHKDQSSAHELSPPAPRRRSPAEHIVRNTIYPTAITELALRLRWILFETTFVSDFPETQGEKFRRATSAMTDGQ